MRSVPCGTVQATVPAALSMVALLPETLAPKLRKSFAVEVVVKLNGAAAQSVCCELVALKVK